MVAKNLTLTHRKSIRVFSGGSHLGKKRRRWVPHVFAAPKENCSGTNLLDLPDVLVVSILCILGHTSQCPADFFNVLLTCKRLNELALDPIVLSSLSSKAIAIKARNWSDSAHEFLERCVSAGSIEACYTLGMVKIQHYCLQSIRKGTSLMARAAITSHTQALYSLAVIHFNGSGIAKDLKAGLGLCARAGFHGHVVALREIGHCLQDGYGVTQNFSEGRRFLVLANVCELAAVLSSQIQTQSMWLSFPPIPEHGHNCPLLSDVGCTLPPREPHPVNKFLVEWFAIHWRDLLREGLKLCSERYCGRPEKRKHEFRKCSRCGAVYYCSRSCQALDWKLRHNMECDLLVPWPHGGG